MSRSQSSTPLALLLLGSFVGGLGLAVAASHVPSLVPSWCRRAAPRRVYVLLVRLKLNPAMGGRRAFQDAFEPLAQAVQRNEPRCLSYEVSFGEEDENEVCIYERYVDKADLVGTHNSGAEFKAFGKRLGEGNLKGLVLSKEKMAFVESNTGFMER